MPAFSVMRYLELVDFLLVHGLVELKEGEVGLWSLVHLPSHFGEVLVANLPIFIVCETPRGSRMARNHYVSCRKQSIDGQDYGEKSPMKNNG